MSSNKQYTIAGCLAILLWSATVGLVRNVAEQLGPIGGAAMIYSVSALFLIMVLGIPHLKRFSVKYIMIGGALFVSYEICLSLALGMANSRIQAVEMGVINYLWPTLVVLLTALTSHTKIDKRVYPVIALSFFGVAWTVSGDQGLSAKQLADNFITNPTSYSLALIGAFIWAFYCNITKKRANGKNAITLFFIATAITLWVFYFISDEATMVFNSSSVIDLLITGIAMGSAYALWNSAIIGGNMMLLATLSYFTPLLSTFISAMILDIELTATFWQGVMMVTIASLLCWWFTRQKGTS
ncbi:aromatic amino acid exporter [Psychromonas marina]|uniref:Aromatic amino acid exporter n=1 Tax=Psychromonas marina TaxID=88364 RepID=A0ABQ6E1G5_9GAMM|nr:aromatic amino acid exporter [Psychromonas marina]